MCCWRRLLHHSAVLGLFGTATAAPLCAQATTDLAQQIAGLPALTAGQRVDALTAIADALPFAADPDRAAAVGALRLLAKNGVFYSPSPRQPTLTWFQYERALRRSEVRDAGDEPAALSTTLQLLRARRATMLPLIQQLGGNREAPSVYDLTAFGWHGAGEVLEAVADLAARRGGEARAVGAELAKYLACEQPHPAQPHPEGAAGCGEPTPDDAPESRFPILWGDGYRFALARAVLATEPPGVDPSGAVQHLLYSPRRDDRLDAIARLRKAQLDTAAVTHLGAQLDDADRIVVREALLALGDGGPAVETTRQRLRRIAGGDDRELRTLAARALEQLEYR